MLKYVKDSNKIKILKIKESSYKYYVSQMRIAISLEDVNTILCNILNELGLSNIVDVSKSIKNKI